MPLIVGCWLCNLPIGGRLDCAPAGADSGGPGGIEDFPARGLSSAIARSLTRSARVSRYFWAEPWRAE